MTNLKIPKSFVLYGRSGKKAFKLLKKAKPSKNPIITIEQKKAFEAAFSRLIAENK